MTATLILPLIYSIVLPVVLVIWWKKKTGAKMVPFLVGALCFFGFAMILESLVHQLVLVGDNAVSRTINGSAILYVLYASFAAGIFEETSRLFGFKVLLKNYNRKENAVAYGIGHGGIEVLLLLGTTYLVYVLAVSGVTIGTPEATATLVEAANAIPLNSALLAMFERISALMIHIGLSMIMFVAVKGDKKMWLYPLAICLHAIADMPAAMYQKTGKPSLAVLEAFTFVLGLIVLIVGKKILDANADKIDAKANTLHISIRRLNEGEKQEALNLSWEVFKQFEAPDYSEEGVQEFRKSLDDKERTAALKYYGAFDGDRMVGTLCMREPQHIGGFFVKAKYQGLGIGRKLFEVMKQDYDRQEFTVNSSPYAVEIYKKLGFEPTDTEQVVNGLRFTPMTYKGDGPFSSNEEKGTVLEG